MSDPIEPVAPVAVHPDEDFKVLYEKSAEELKQIKLKQSGADKKVSDLLHELDEMKKSQMKAEERREYERVQREKELAEKETALKKQTIDFHKVRMLAKYNFDETFMNRIHGETPEDIEADTKTLRDYIDGLSKTKADEEVGKRLATGPKPTGGSGPETGGIFTDEKVNKLPVDDLAKLQKAHPAEWRAYVSRQAQEPVTSN